MEAATRRSRTACKTGPEYLEEHCVDTVAKARIMTPLERTREQWDQVLMACNHIVRRLLLDCIPLAERQRFLTVAPPVVRPTKHLTPTICDNPLCQQLFTPEAWHPKQRFNHCSPECREMHKQLRATAHGSLTTCWVCGAEFRLTRKQRQAPNSRHRCPTCPRAQVWTAQRTLEAGVTFWQTYERLPVKKDLRREYKMPSYHMMARHWTSLARFQDAILRQVTQGATAA